MKTVSILLFLIVCSKTLIGQKLSISTLSNQLNKNYDVVDSKFTSLKYSFESSYELGDGTAYAYSIGQFKDGYSEYSVTFKIVNEKCKMVQHQTSFLSDYTAWKTELKNIGFEFSKILNEENKVTQVYYNKTKDIFVELVSDIAKNPYGKRGTRYYIVLY